MAFPPSQKFSVLNQCFTFFNQNIIITSSLGELYAPRKALPPFALLIPVESLGPKGRTLTSRHTPILEPTTPLGPTLLNGKFPMEHFYPKPSRSMGQYLISKTPLLEHFQTSLLEHSRHAPLLVDASHLKQTRHAPLLVDASHLKQTRQSPLLEAKTPLMEHNISVRQEKSFFHAPTKTPLMDHNISMMQEQGTRLEDGCSLV